MITKELQDRVWSILPQEFKKEVKRLYNEYRFTRGGYYDGLFGHHNLTSDEESEEMLCISRKRVQDAYKNCDRYSYYEDLLTDLFGSKCLPDDANAKAEPKIKIGYHVRVCNKNAARYGRIGTVIAIYANNTADVDFGDGYVGGHLYNLDFLEPYTEPTESAHEDNFASKPKSDNMEEKELDLCEILKGYEGELIYSLVYGDMVVEAVTDTGVRAYMDDEDKYSELFKSNGKLISTAECILYPSRDLYLKYPLDAKAAWEEWQEEQKPKTPKTWNKLREKYLGIVYNLNIIDEAGRYMGIKGTPLEMSAVALLRIHQLIEVGYGGNVTYERCASINYDNVFKIAPCGLRNNLTFDVDEVEGESEMNHVMFHTKEQAEEFLSYPENVQLLKDYFMI